MAKSGFTATGATILHSAARHAGHTLTSASCGGSKSPSSRCFLKPPDFLCYPHPARTGAAHPALAGRRERD